MIDQQKETS